MIVASSDFVEQPLISVQILTYNQEKYIAQAIESIVTQQTTFDFEVIIGDDCSSDKTQLICRTYQKNYPQRIKLLLNDKNVGVAHNYINTVTASRGKYITTIGGDDFMHNPKRLQILVDYMEQHINCGVLHTDYDILYDNTGRFEKSVNQSHNIIPPCGFVQTHIFNGSSFIRTVTVAIRKDAFDKYIPKDKYIELNFPIEDWPTQMILSNYVEFHYLPISTATYRIGQDSITNPKKVDFVISRFKREKIMYKYICSLFPEKCPYIECEYDSYVDNVILNRAFLLDNYQVANQYGKKCLKRNIKYWCSQSRLLFIVYRFMRYRRFKR